MSDKHITIPRARLAELERAEEERDSLLADAERYRWLRDAHPADPSSIWVARGLPQTGLSAWRHEELDAAIDAARASLAAAIRSPQQPTPAEPAPLWAPEGLVAHDDDRTPHRCKKCCLVDREDECRDALCGPAGHSYAHPSGRPVYFTRAPHPGQTP